MFEIVVNIVVIIAILEATPFLMKLATKDV